MRPVGFIVRPVLRGRLSLNARGGFLLEEIWFVQRGEAAAKAVFGEDAGEQEILRIFHAAGFGAAAAHFKAAEGLTAHDRAGDAAVDVEVAAD